MLQIKSLKPGTREWLHQAIAISVFSDARAGADDELPGNTADRRGHWGDYELPAGSQLGSLLWLLRREKMTDALARRARSYIYQALMWLLDDKWIVALDVTTWRDGERLRFITRCRLPGGIDVDDNWEASGDLST